MTDAAAELGTYDRVYSTMTFHHLLPDAKQRGARMSRARARARWQLRRRRLQPTARSAPARAVRWIQQPLDGYQNTRPHRDGRFEQAVRETFGQVRSAAVWRTVAGTIEMFVCAP